MTKKFLSSQWLIDKVYGGTWERSLYGWANDLSFSIMEERIIWKLILNYIEDEQYQEIFEFFLRCKIWNLVYVVKKEHLEKVFSIPWSFMICLPRYKDIRCEIEAPELYAKIDKLINKVKMINLSRLILENKIIKYTIEKELKNPESESYEILFGTEEDNNVDFNKKFISKINHLIDLTDFDELDLNLNIVQDKNKFLDF